MWQFILSSRRYRYPVTTSPSPFPIPCLPELEKCWPSRKNLSQTLDVSLVHKPLFGEGRLWSCPQPLCSTEAEFLKQPPLNEEGSVESPLPMLVRCA